MQSHFHMYVTVFWVVFNVLFLNNYIGLGIQRNLTQTTVISKSSKYKLNVHSSPLGFCEETKKNNHLSNAPKDIMCNCRILDRATQNLEAAKEGKWGRRKFLRMNSKLAIYITSSSTIN